MAVSAEDRLAISELIALHGHIMNSGELDRLEDLFSPRRRRQDRRRAGYTDLLGERGDLDGGRSCGESALISPRDPYRDAGHPSPAAPSAEPPGTRLAWRISRSGHGPEVVGDANMPPSATRVRAAVSARSVGDGPR